MSEAIEENKAGTPPTQPQQAPPVVDAQEAPKAKKIFSRADVVRTVPISLHIPTLYPDFAPWEFELRLKLTEDAEERRQEYLALSPTEQTVKESEQNLDELCDLMVSAPKGFADLQYDGKSAGSSFKNYVMTSDEATKDMLLTVTRGAITLYWRKISPQEFRKSV